MRQSFKRAGYVVVAVLLGLAGAVTGTALAESNTLVSSDDFIDNPRFIDNPNSPTP